MPSSFGKGHQAIQNLVQLKKEEIAYFIGDNTEVMEQYFALLKELSELETRSHNARMNKVDEITKVRRS